MLNIQQLYDFMLLCTMFQYGYSAVKTWKPNADITNSINWQTDTSTTSECNGIYFDASNTAPIFIQNLVVKQIVLPANGELDFVDGGSVQFRSTSQCIKLKSINYYDLDDPENWAGDNNPAIPHLDRLPCDYDDIVLPNGLNSRLRFSEFYFSPEFRFKSLRLGNQLKLTESNINQFQNSDIKDKIFFHATRPVRLEINSEPCNDETDKAGCTCHEENWINCHDDMPVPKTLCRDPIDVRGFCHLICGAAITGTPNEKFDMPELRQLLRSFTVSTHATRYNDYFDGSVILIIFTEEAFTGKSLEEAQEFYQQIKSKNYFTDISLETSGEYYVENKLSATLGLVFGTFFFVILIFVVFFYVYENINLNFTRPNLLFARFNTRGGHLIVDTQSMVGSVISLHRQQSFDNPMYGRRTSSASSSLAASDETKSSTIQKMTEPTNPLYDISLKEIEKEPKEEHVENLD